MALQKYRGMKRVSNHSVLLDAHRDYRYALQNPAAAVMKPQQPVRRSCALTDLTSQQRTAMLLNGVVVTRIDARVVERRKAAFEEARRDREQMLASLTLEARLAQQYSQ